MPDSTRGRASDMRVIVSVEGSLPRNRGRRSLVFQAGREPARMGGMGTSGEEREAREAVRQAYSAHYRRLVAALYGLTGDYSDAQDLVQEAYARALARPRQFLDVADPAAWLRLGADNPAPARV